MREVLAACPYGDNDVYLHTDPALMPVRRATWASWNFLGTSAPDGADAAVCVSYWVNHLQVCLRAGRCCYSGVSIMLIYHCSSLPVNCKCLQHRAVN